MCHALMLIGFRQWPVLSVNQFVTAVPELERFSYREGKSMFVPILESLQLGRRYQVG
jgi:hypothetical protein